MIIHTVKDAAQGRDLVIEVLGHNIVLLKIISYDLVETREIEFEIELNDLETIVNQLKLEING